MNQMTKAFFLCTYLVSILLTQPWLTRRRREISQGRTPRCASSTMRCLTTCGNGRPLMKTPPSWLTPPCTEHRSRPKKHHLQREPARLHNFTWMLNERMALTVRNGERRMSKTYFHHCFVTRKVSSTVLYTVFGEENNLFHLNISEKSLLRLCPVCLRCKCQDSLQQLLSAPEHWTVAPAFDWTIAHGLFVGGKSVIGC